MHSKGKVVSKPIENPIGFEKVIWKRGNEIHISNIHHIENVDGGIVVFVPDPENEDRLIKGFAEAFKELFIEEPADLAVKSASMGTITHLYHPLVKSDWRVAVLKEYVDSDKEVEFGMTLDSLYKEVALLMDNHVTVTGDLITSKELWDIYNSLDRPYGVDNIWGWMEDNGFVIIKKENGK